MSDADRRYRFHPLERRGLVLGLGAPQLAVLAGGAAAAVIAVRSGAGLVAPILVLLAACAAACVPVAGASVVEWAPVVAAWARRAAHPRVGAAGGTAAPAGVRLRAAPQGPGEPPLGVVHDRRSGAWAAVLPVAGAPVTLLDAEDKQRQLAAWGAVLASTARPSTPIFRLQWVERTSPVDVGALRAHLEGAPTAEGPPCATCGAPGGAGGARERRAGYRALIGTAASGAAHDALLVLSVHPRSAGRQLRAFGSGPPAVCALLRRELRLLAGQLRQADIEARAPLDLPQLARAVRATYEPAAAHGEGGMRGDADAWPAAWQDGWSCARVDGRWQATYWIAEWPRREIGPDFLLPLLLTSVPRVVSVTMAPVPTRAAVREAETARTAELADEELRRRAGFLSTARHRRRAEGVAHREAELADGHGELRFAGYVGVSGRTPEELEDAAAAVEAAAQQCGLELRRLYGRQEEALTWTLPLGRGLG